MNLTKYICELLYQYDCVIVPGFGGSSSKSVRRPSIYRIKCSYHQRKY
ncbi:MAG: hypothetical protein ACMUEM_07020 [Flavobacteriales bacterium AspAUS03]